MASAFLDEVRTVVDAGLAALFERKLAAARAIAPDAALLVECIRDLTMRGGKRLRPALVFGACRAVGAKEVDVLRPAMALELLQTYLLVQDDWMDKDEVRRGGPSVHAMLRARIADRHTADAAAILASDLASAYAEELMAGSGALAAYAQMHQEVVFGQLLDLRAHEDVDTIHLLKTASYTVRRPLRIGAILGGASPAQLDALDGFGRPVGIAFQLQDDLLGTFGDPAVTGKAASSDLREGKRTAIVAEARARLADPRALDRVLGNRGASEAELAAAREALEACGARRAVEQRAEALLQAGFSALEGASFDPAGKALLEALARRMVHRAA